MSENISIQQKIQQYRQLNPNLKDLSDEQILSIMSKNGEISLTKDQKISLYSSKTNTSNNHSGVEIEKQTAAKTIILRSGEKIVISSGINKYYSADGKELNQKDFEQQVGILDVRNSGRYSITKNGETRYYAFNGTELNEAYFKQVENNDLIIEASNGKRYNFNKTLEKRINNVSTNLKKAEDENGFIGSTWSGFKNITGIGDSSDNVREQQEIEKKLLEQFNTTEQNRSKVFKELTGFDYTEENLEKFIKGEIKLKSEIALNGYKEGQAMAVDVGADILSGVAAVGIYTAAVAAAPFTGGGSIAVGIAAAGVSGAAIKTGMKAADATTGGREYSLKDAAHDAATGTFSGVIAPVTGGLGGAVGKTVATKLGVQAVKQVGKEVAETAVESGVKQTIKTALTNPTGYEYVGGNIAKKSLALGAEMATDGAVGGSVDNAFRTAIDGGSLEDVAKAAGEGFVGGAILSPVIGGGMKSVGKGVQKIFGKDNVHIDGSSRKIEYIRPSKVSKEQLITNPKLKEHPECEYLFNRIGTNKTDLKAIFLEMYLTNDILSSNKSLNEKLSRGLLFFKSDRSLKFLQDFINYEELHNNKNINACLADIVDAYDSNNTNYIKKIEKYIEKFIKNDMTVVDDILSDSNHVLNYYYKVPKSFINKDIEDMTANEIDELKEIILNNRFAPPSTNFLKGIFPAIPSDPDEFMPIANRINKLNHSKQTLINLDKLDELDNIGSIVSGNEVSQKSIKDLKQIRLSKYYKDLSDRDKQLLSIATLLQDVNISPKILFDIMHNSGFNKRESEKAVNIVKSANLIADFMKTNKDYKEYLETYGQKIQTNQRKEFFDNIAFILKEDNTFQLAKILYSSKDIDGFTRYLDKMLEMRIKEIKSEDFMLPQTPRDVYHKKAKMVTVKKGGKEYKVRTVKRSEIPNFNAYVHTPENVSALKDASIWQNTAKFTLASNDNLSERVICACYVDGTSKSFVNNRYVEGSGNGFILQVPNSKQYVGAGSDIESIAKERHHLLSVYYNNNDLINHGVNVPKGTKTSELKSIISNNIKSILNISDEEYIKRIDKIKNTLGDEILSLEKLKVIDSEMADAYEQFLKRRIGKDADFKSAILRDDYEWNEYLLSEAKISDIYTTHLDLLSEEYLKMAADPNNDYVIILMYE